MGLEPGTRVKYVNKGALYGEGGTYLGMYGAYHIVHWDSASYDWNDLHTVSEFEQDRTKYE